MQNPNRKTASVSKFVTWKNILLVTISILLIGSMITIWVGYNQITERNEQIDKLSNDVVEISKQLKETKTKNEENEKVIGALNAEVTKQKETVSSLNDEINSHKTLIEKFKVENQKLKNDNNDLTKKYREFVKP
ncbi:gp687 [Bacillus phage G]|uniref:Gp687 n=1 Tax=Bacillus phage G TaxID=2884420 RepID=G3MB67_9CAUD|nr:gp687 [Bacillus phage G]AEO93930.1 gp687 [Bacillus phage G]